jgi:glutamate-1-semialdehyde 2,1-aminomutase
MARFSRSGGEAMAIAVRIARASTGRDKVLFCGYHGWHDWYLATNLEDASNLNQHLIAGLSPIGVPKGLKGTAIPFHYNDAAELAGLIRKHGPDVAAIVMEPIRNHEPKDNFLQEVREIADRNKSILILDEISAGFRLCTGGAHLKYDLRPDIAVFSKALGNGYPISAIIGRGSIMEAVQTSFISSTNWTERIGPTAALAMIQKFENKKVYEHLVKIGSLVQSGWRETARKHNVSIDIGGIPPLSHFSFNEKNSADLKALFIQLLLEDGFLASTNFYPMYAHTETHVFDYLKSCDKAFAKLSANLHNPDIRSLLYGDPAKSGFARLT